MQNRTMATAPKRGMKLQLFNNPKSLAKANTLKPEVRFHSMQHSDVLRSDGRTYAHVSFTLIENEIWACCDCHAAFRGLPCYHVTAAALELHIIKNPADSPVAVHDDVVASLTYDACQRYDRARFVDDDMPPLHLEIVDDNGNDDWHPADVDPFVCPPPVASRLDRFRPAARPTSGRFTDDDGAEVSWSVNHVAVAAEEAYFLRKHGAWADQL